MNDISITAGDWRENKIAFPKITFTFLHIDNSLTININFDVIETVFQGAW